MDEMIKFDWPVVPTKEQLDDYFRKYLESFIPGERPEQRKARLKGAR